MFNGAGVLEVWSKDHHRYFDNLFLHRLLLNSIAFLKIKSLSIQCFCNNLTIYKEHRQYHMRHIVFFFTAERLIFL